MKVVGRDPVPELRDKAAAWAPASLSNLGPGFDVLGIAVNAWGDRIEAIRTEGSGIVIGYAGDSIWTGVTDPGQNTAGVAADRTLKALGRNGGVELIIHKNISPGSGVGSSAASAVAAAWAVNLLFGTQLSKEQLIQAVLEGEAVASGAMHGDNAIPALFGGTAIVSASDPSTYRRLRVDESLQLSIVLPNVQILTRAAREMLPEQVPFRDAMFHSSSLAMLVDSLKDGDWPAVGRYIMDDRIVEPVRSRLLSCYDAVKRAALEAGAYGCAISGSGPAMFAVSEDPERAGSILQAMIEASEAAGIEADGTVTTPDNEGVREWVSPDSA